MNKMENFAIKKFQSTPMFTIFKASSSILRELSQLVQCGRKERRGEKFMIYVHQENSQFAFNEYAFDVLMRSIMNFIYELISGLLIKFYIIKEIFKNLSLTTLVLKNLCIYNFKIFIFHNSGKFLQFIHKSGLYMYTCRVINIAHYSK